MADNVKFFTGTDETKLPAYSASTVGQVYFVLSVADVDQTKWSGKIIYDSPEGRVTMSTQALTADYDTNFCEITNYIKSVTMDESGILSVTNGKGAVNTFNLVTPRHVHEFTPEGAITVSVAEDDLSNYTPAGTITIPVVNIATQETTVIKEIDMGELPTLNLEVKSVGETLIIDWNAGTLPTITSTVSVVEKITEATASQPEFQGIPVKVEFNGTTGTTGQSKNN